MSETTTREAYAADLADPASSPKPGIMATRDLANLNLLRTVGVGLVFVGHLTATMRVRALGDLGAVFFPRAAPSVFSRPRRPGRLLTAG